VCKGARATKTYWSMSVWESIGCPQAPLLEGAKKAVNEKLVPGQRTSLKGKWYQVRHMLAANLFSHTHGSASRFRGIAESRFFVNFSGFAYTVFVVTYSNYSNYFGVLYRSRLTSSYPQPSWFKTKGLAPVPPNNVTWHVAKVICRADGSKFLNSACTTS